MFSSGGPNTVASDRLPFEGIENGTRYLAGCIDPLTGSWHDNEIDLKINGSTLTVSRSHNSREEGLLATRFGLWNDESRPSLNFWTRWGWNHSTLFHYLPDSNTTHLADEFGQHLTFEHNVEGKGTLKAENFKHWTNCALGWIGSSTDAHNYELFFDKKQGKLTTPRGEKRLFSEKVFSNTKKHERVWMCAEKERQYPSGLKWAYEHHKLMDLAKVEEIDRQGHVLQHIVFEDKGLKAVTSTGDWAKYHLDNSFKAHPLLLIKVESSQKATISYEYVQFEFSWWLDQPMVGHIGDCWYNLPPLVTKKIDERGRYRRMTYRDTYPKNGHVCYGLAPYVEPHAGKILAYYGPVGKDGKEEAIYSFEYGENKTLVRSANGKVDEYKYSDKLRLESLEETAGGKKLRSSFYTYSTADQKIGTGEGLVLRSWLKDSADQCQYLKTFEYDEKGNVIKNCMFTAITPNAQGPKLDAKGNLQANQSDCYEVRYEYDKELPTHKVAEYYPDGSSIKYVYEPGTDKIQARLCYQPAGLVERRFYAYDNFSQTILEIEDDGCTIDPGSFEGVSHRKVIRRTVVPSGSCSGLIHEEILSIWDVEKGREIPQLSRQYRYSPQRKKIAEIETDLITGVCSEKLFDYDDHNNIIYEKNERGAEVFRQFDVDDRLLVEKTSAGVARSYGYDADRRLKFCIETHVEYPGIEWKTMYEHDAMGNMVRITDPYGLVREFIYDQAGRLVCEQLQGTTDEMGQLRKTPITKEYGYDIEDKLIWQKDESGFTHCKEYNGLGSVKCETLPSGERIDYRFDKCNRLIQKDYDKAAWSEIFSYDDQNRLVSVTTQEGESVKTSLKYEYKGRYKSRQVDVLGHEDRWSYDGLGRIIDHIRSDVDSSKVSRNQLAYDGCGRVIMKRTWQDGAHYIEARYQYNAAGDLVKEWLQTSLGQIYQCQEHAYNILGKRIRSWYQAAEGIVEQKWNYDSFGNLVEHIDAEGYKTATVYTYKHSSQGALEPITIRQERADLTVECITLDKQQCKISSLLYDAKGLLAQSKRMGYDEKGRLVMREEEPISEGQRVGAKVVTKIVYGPSDQILERWDALGSNVERYRKWEYDERGVCVAKYEPSGLIQYYSYDAKKHLTRCWSSDSTIDYYYSYDDLGREIAVKNQITGKQTTRSYDAWGHVTFETLENGWTFGREWNGLGQPITDIYADNTKLKRTYEGGLLRKSCREKWLLSYEHKVTSYDRWARACQEELPFGAGSIKCNYDVKARISSFERPWYYAKNLKYDASGNLIARTVSSYDDINSYGKRSETFSYDALGQICEECSSSKHKYQHDSRQRRLLADDTSYLNDDLDQIEEIKGAKGHERCTYDLLGRLIKREQDWQVWDYTYDAWSRLTTIKGQGVQIEFSYDSYDRRISKRVVYVSEQTVLSNYGYLGQLLAQATIDGVNHKRFFVRGTGSERGDILSWEGPEGTCLPIHDMAGSCIGWTNKSNTPLGLWHFDSFGQVKGSMVGPWGYNSKLHDGEVGLIYFGRRYYQPLDGRWLTRDPKGDIDGSNLYAFVGNNPVTRCDDWGLFCSEFFYPSDAFYKLGREISSWEKPSFSEIMYLEGLYAGFDPCVRDINDDIHTGNFNVKGSCVGFYKYSGADAQTYQGRVSFTNGNGNTYKDAAHVAMKISQDFKSDIALIYNWSAREKFETPFGDYLDAKRAKLQRTGFPIRTGAEKALVHYCQLMAQQFPGQSLLSLAHSNGYQVHFSTYHSNKGDQEIKGHFRSMWVVGLAGSGDALKPDNQVKNVINTVCTNDVIIRWCDGGAIQRQREMGVLYEPEPVLYEGANKWGGLSVWVNKIVPDHFIDGNTCQEAIKKARDLWK